MVEVILVIGALGYSVVLKLELGENLLIPEMTPCKDQNKVTRVTKRLLFHCRLLKHSQKWNLHSLSDNRGNTKGIGQQFNLFHLFSGGSFPTRRTIGLE